MEKLRSLMGIKDQVRLGVKNDLKKLKELGVQNLVVFSGKSKGRSMLLLVN